MAPLTAIDQLQIALPDGALSASAMGERGERGPAALAVHGILSSSRTWVRVARALQGRAQLIAVDLRGRGRSSELPPPFGIARHVGDLLAVLDQLELERAVIVGHSLGAYIAARLAADHPERVSSALLIDGGLTIPGTEGVDPQAFADAFLGPALARLRMTFPDRESYRDWWRAHPAILTSDVDDADLAAYADYDLIGEPPAMRSCISERAVRADAAELFELGKPARHLDVPATLLCAPRGLLDDPNPMQPLELAQAWAAERPDQRRAVQIPDVNHYTITMGAAGAAAVADQIAAAIALTTA
jgi:pimeloyl-ACP methyl ester carboxylesterase